MNWRSGLRFSTGTRDYYPLQNVQTGYGVQRFFCWGVRRAIFWQVKRPGAWSWPLTIIWCRGEVSGGALFTCIHDVHRNNVTFTILSHIYKCNFVERVWIVEMFLDSFQDCTCPSVHLTVYYKVRLTRDIVFSHIVFSSLISTGSRSVGAV